LLLFGPITGLFGLVPVPIIFFGLIPVPVLFFGLVTTYYPPHFFGPIPVPAHNSIWSCYYHPICFWSCYSPPFLVLLRLDPLFLVLLRAPTIIVETMIIFDSHDYANVLHFDKY
jgi:hypothetical protein